MEFLYFEEIRFEFFVENRSFPDETIFLRKFLKV